MKGQGDRLSGSRQSPFLPTTADPAALLDVLPDACLLVSSDGRILYANTAAEVLFGRTRSELVRDTSIEDLVPPSSREAHRNFRKNYVAESRPRRMGSDLALTAVRKDGSAVAVDIMLQPIATPKGRAVLAVVRDLTEKMALLRELHQQQYRLVETRHLDLLGKLAAGIAHDFNNELLVIRGYAERVLRSARALQAGKIAEETAEILAAAERAAELARSLSRYARGQGRAGKPRPLELDAQVESFTRVIGPAMAEAGMTVRAELGAPGVHVRLRPADIQRILLNLAMNARDAMRRGGTFTLRTSVASSPAAAEPVVRLVAEDDGHGMKEEVRRRIFDRFYTTKGRRGTGLGLATVRELVEEAGGTIDVESAPGQGATFTLTFPICH